MKYTKEDIRRIIKEAKKDGLDNLGILAKIDELNVSDDDMNYVYDVLQEEGIDATNNGDEEILNVEEMQETDSFQAYLKEIAQIPQLSQEEEIKYLIQFNEGETKEDRENAKNELVTHNMRLVVSIAKKFHKENTELRDLIQEGKKGLMKAVDKFDYKKGFRFSTYATWWIRQAILRYAADEEGGSRIPAHLKHAK